MRKFIGAILFLFCMFADNAGAQVNKQYFVWVGRDMVMDSRYREAIETLNILLRAGPLLQPGRHEHPHGALPRSRR